MLRTGGDILYPLLGNPLLPFDPTSSLGCGVCDRVIADWCFAGAPSLFEVIRGKGIRQPPRIVWVKGDAEYTCESKAREMYHAWGTRENRQKNRKSAHRSVRVA